MTTHYGATVLANQMDGEAGYDYRPVLKQPAALGNGTISDTELGRMYQKSGHSFILAIVSFIVCFFFSLGALSPTVICHIPAMLFAIKSRVSAEKKDYYDSKLMLHWSYICTFAGCFLGGMVLLGTILLVVLPIAITVSK